MKMSAKKATKAPRRPATETTKVNLTLGVEQYRRLFVTSVMSGETASAIVANLIDQHLRAWRVQENPAVRDRGSDRLESADAVIELHAEAA